MALTAWSQGRKAVQRTAEKMDVEGARDLAGRYLEGWELAHARVETLRLQESGLALRHTSVSLPHHLQDALMKHAGRYAVRTVQDACCACSGAGKTVLPPCLNAGLRPHQTFRTESRLCYTDMIQLEALTWHARSNPAFEADSGDSKAKRTSSDWGSVSLSRTGSPTKGPNAASALPRRCSEELGGSWMRPAATSAFHSRTGSVLSDWPDSEGLSPFPSCLVFLEPHACCSLGISASDHEGYEQ